MQYRTAKNDMSSDDWIAIFHSSEVEKVSCMNNLKRSIVTDIAFSIQVR